MKIRQTYDRSIEIDGAGEAHAAYRHGPGLPKPCVHPITTPAGRTLTGFQMSDHIWHRGLWFTIKFINGENFWEENAPFGVQVSAEQPRASFAGPDSSTIEHALNWTRPSGDIVIRERRTIDFIERDGISIIDWSSTLEPQNDLLLDRTPYTTWGGYSGLTFRAPREFHKATFVVPGGQAVPQLLGDRHEWVVLQGQLDGGIDERVSVGMIDHPANPRSTTPWYGKSADNYVFFNAAFLFHEPMNVAKGQPLRFRYRTIYRDGTWTADEFAQLAAMYREGKP